MERARDRRAHGVFPTAVGEVFNVGSTHELTIWALAERVGTPAGSDDQPGFEDRWRRILDIRTAEGVAGDGPRMSFDETLKRVIEHLRDIGRG